MKRRILLVSLLALSLTSWAEMEVARTTRRNELRIGWGDQLFESLVWHNPEYYTRLTDYSDVLPTLTKPGDYRQTYKENYTYYQHVWVEYQRRHGRCFGVGFLMDGSGVSWQEVTRNGYGEVVETDPKTHNFYNLVFMPTMRFTYLYREHVNLYSGFGLGLGINGGTEQNWKDKKLQAGLAANLTLLGVSVNFGSFFLAAEYGGMYSLKNANTVFLCKSRMFATSLGVRF